jgi:hypothetical protein
VFDLPSLLVACKYSDLARWYILQLTYAVAISSRYCLSACSNSATVMFVETCRINRMHSLRESRLI